MAEIYIFYVGQKRGGRRSATTAVNAVKDVELTRAESIFNDGVGVDSANVGRVGGKRGPGESL